MPAANQSCRPAEHAPGPGRGFTVADVARRYRVGEDKVRSWIRCGQLLAVNTASSRCGRPRFVILPDHLAAFERLRAATTKAKPAPRRRRQATGAIDYFPD